MTRRILACTALGLLALAPARAGASAQAVSGTLRIDLGVSPFGFEVSVAGTATLNGSGGDLHLGALSLPPGIASGSAELVFTDPASDPIDGLLVAVANAAGSFAPTAGGFGGVMPLPGLLRLCLFGTCDSAVANLSVPLTPVGAGGTLVVATGMGNFLTVTGAPWTTGTVTPVPTFPTITGMGFRHGPASASSSTAANSGALQLVTPIRFRASFGTVDTPGLGRLTLHFVPEPAGGVLVAIGACLVAAGRRAGRARHRRSGG
jgi:hypothetical protein